MKIYTKKGDAGGTELFGGVKVSKDNQRIRTYGSLDELNAIVGLILAEKGVPEPTRQELSTLQADLFRLGAELATPVGKKLLSQPIGSEEIQTLEKQIDTMEAQLEPLKSFILPGGTREASLLHLARTICRRAERELAALHQTEAQRTEVLQYVNRLSDYLFVAARFANRAAGVADLPWKGTR